MPTQCNFKRLYDKVLLTYSKQCSYSAEVMMDRHRRRLANIKPAVVQPPAIINVVLNNN